MHSCYYPHKGHYIYAHEQGANDQQQDVNLRAVISALLNFLYVANNSNIKGWYSVYVVGQCGNLRPTRHVIWSLGSHYYYYYYLLLLLLPNQKNIDQASKTSHVSPPRIESRTYLVNLFMFLDAQ